MSNEKERKNQMGFSLKIYPANPIFKILKGAMRFELLFQIDEKKESRSVDCNVEL